MKDRYRYTAADAVHEELANVYLTLEFRNGDKVTTELHIPKNCKDVQVDYEKDRARFVNGHRISVARFRAFFWPLLLAALLLVWLWAST